MCHIHRYTEMGYVAHRRMWHICVLGLLARLCPAHRNGGTSVSWHVCVLHTEMGYVPHTQTTSKDHKSESCPTYQWVMSYIQMSHVPRTNESCPKYEWVMSNIQMSFSPHAHGSRPTYTRVVSCMQISHVLHAHDSCPTYEWVMSHMYICDTTQSASNTASLSRSSCARANQSRPTYE